MGREVTEMRRKETTLDDDVKLSDKLPVEKHARASYDRCEGGKPRKRFVRLYNQENKEWSCDYTLPTLLLVTTECCSPTSDWCQRTSHTPSITERPSRDHMTTASAESKQTTRERETKLSDVSTKSYPQTLCKEVWQT